MPIHLFQDNLTLFRITNLREKPEDLPELQEISKKQKSVPLEKIGPVESSIPSEEDSIPYRLRRV